MRPATLHYKFLKVLVKRDRSEFTEEDFSAPPIPRPLTRADCANIPRPCPFVSCRFNLYLDVLPTKSIKLNFPEIDPCEMKESCALDVADRGGLTLSETADILRLTRERVRQIEARVVESIRRVRSRLRQVA